MEIRSLLRRAVTVTAVIIVSAQANARQLLVPNVGNSQPGFPPTTSSEIGQGPTNPNAYEHPENTPPVAEMNRSCTSGVSNAATENSPSTTNPDVDFNTSYRCAAGLTSSNPRDDSDKTALDSPQQAGIARTQQPVVPNEGVDRIPGLQGNTDESSDSNSGPVGSNSGAVGNSGLAH